MQLLEHTRSFAYSNKEKRAEDADLTDQADSRGFRSVLIRRISKIRVPGSWSLLNQLV